jgi:hypothetical protein
MKQILARPAFWLACQSLLLALWMWSSGRLVPQIETDTRSYLDVPLESLSAALSAIRTLGYPLFLRTVTRLSGGVGAVPSAHLVVHVASVFAFGLGLRRAGLDRAIATAAASAVLWSKGAFEYIPVVLGDSLGLSLAVAAIGLLLCTLPATRRGVHWVGLTILVALAYHVRPAYLFLVPLIPLLGMLLHRSVIASNAQQYSGTLRFGIRLAAASCLPLLAWCGLRWLVVGHFGLVSFGGYNLVGIAGQFVDEPLVGELPGELQPVAARILEIRERTPGWEPPRDYYAMERMFNVTVWTICVPAVRESVSEDPVRVNRTISALCREVLLRRPAAYLRWLSWALREGLTAILFLSLTNKPAIVCLGLLMACEGGELFRRRKRAHNGIAVASTACDMAGRARPVLVWTAVGFAAANLLLVVLVEVPNHRYMTAASVFLPALLAVLCVNRCRHFIASGSPSDRSAPRDTL